MSRKLFRLLLVVHAGGQSVRPAATGLARLVIAFGGAVGFGLAIGFAAWKAALSHALPTIWVGLVIATASYALVGLLLLSVDTTAGWSRAQTALGRMTLVWPITRFERWLIHSLPRLAIAAIGLCFAIPIVVALAHALGAPVVWLLAAMLFGASGGFGCGLTRLARSVTITAISFMGTVAAAGWLLAAALHFPERPLGCVCIALGYLLIVPWCISLWRSYYSTGQSVAVAQTVPRVTLGAGHIYGWWFLVKVVRNHRMRASLVWCAVMCSGIAVALRVRHIAVNADTLIISGLLAATFASDVRGAQRRYLPPEITALRGVVYFVAAELQTALILNTVVGLPLLALVWRQAEAVPLMCLYGGLQAAGTALGLLASTIFVPLTGETGSQFFAATTPTLLILATLRLGWFAHMTEISQGVWWLVGATAATALCFVIEQLRRRQYGST